MNYKKIKGILNAKTTIFHGGDEKTGSSPVLRRIDIHDVEQKQNVNIPYIHGNSVRGRLHRLISSDFLMRIGYDFSEIDRSDSSYWVKLLEKNDSGISTKKRKLYYSLFSGGTLEQAKDKVETGIIDLDFRRLMVDAVPVISLFGGAFGNQMIAGKMDCGMLFPICIERRCYLNDIDDDRKNFSVRTFTGSEFITRRDDLRGEREEDEQAHQMKVEREVFIPGTGFDHEFVLKMTNELEESCFHHMIQLYSQHPTIGGNASSGSGLLELNYDLSDLPDVKIYIDYLEKNKKSFVKLFDKIMERI